MKPGVVLAALGLAGVAYGLVKLAGSGTADAAMFDPTTNDTPLNPSTVGLGALAQAISSAEGFGVPGAIPTLAHNPGDLVIPGWTGSFLGSEHISVFASDAEGWRRLYHQLDLIRSGASRVYSPNDSILTLASHWAPHDAFTWANNVINSLIAQGYQASFNTRLADILETN